MSYQRTTEGDAYVIAVGGYHLPEMFGGTWVKPGFECVGCDRTPTLATYQQMIDHLQTSHTDSATAIARLTEEAQCVGFDKTFEDYVTWETAHHPERWAVTP